MDVRCVQRSDKQNTVIVALNSLMKEECRLLEAPSIEVKLVAVDEFRRARVPLVKIFLRHLKRRMRRHRLGLGKLPAIGLVQRDPVTSDVDEEIAPLRKPGIHLVETVNDEVHWRPQPLRHRQFANEPIVELRPIVRPIGQPLVVDDDQQVIVRLIALRRVRLVNPATPCIAAVEDDLGNPALALPVLRRERQRVLEFLEDDLDDALDLALLVRGKMFEAALH